MSRTEALAQYFATYPALSIGEHWHRHDWLAQAPWHGATERTGVILTLVKATPTQCYNVHYPRRS
jgi:hypothetical protein